MELPISLHYLDQGGGAGRGVAFPPLGVIPVGVEARYYLQYRLTKKELCYWHPSSISVVLVLYRAKERGAIWDRGSYIPLVLLGRGWRGRRN